ncbi:pentatricopeptide repeat-containing protein At1g50270-like [Phoenix dactylifera]|uniref:Pentatricopeptide repeat-containing protein At1g50270-like n=1 Tax=Phoenix dactylifera TaxID=42345 RepID=A0A8B8ZIQ2_PHODC|nr:pentatricopeptide repeat-containing protein At1g50270-like [Phoenix dactylifera]
MYRRKSMPAAVAAKITPLQTHLLSLLKGCRTIDHLKQIHSLLVTSGLPGEAFPTAKILHLASLSLPADISYASLIFHQTYRPHASLYNAILRGYSLRSHHDKAVTLYSQMLRDGVIPNEHTYPLVLKSLSRSQNRSPNQIHAQISKLGFDNNSFVQNSLVAVYAKAGDLGSARELFDGIRTRDFISWTAMVHGYVDNDRAVEGLALFAKMRTAGVEIDEVTVVSVLKGAAMVGDVWLGKCIHGFYVECGRAKRDAHVGSALVDMYAKCGYCDDARSLFEEMPCRNVVSWSALIAGCVRCNGFADALSFFQDMLVEGVKPNQATLATVLTACAQLGALEQGRWIHGYVERNKLELNSILGTALIDMYAKCGHIDDAFTIFHAIPEKDVYSWSALIGGMAVHGRASECLNLFSEMVKERVQPNEVTFIGVLSACSHGGLVGQGQSYFNCMMDYGIRPKLEHYGCMVDLLGRAGRLDEALRLIESMTMEPSAGIWGALLNACMIHKDFDLGERIGKHLVRMEPHHSGRYVLLANIYSLSHKWDEAASLRMTMKGRRVEKTRGCSWIEVTGAMHEFVAFDESHSESNNMYETLDGLTKLIKLDEA